MYPITDSMKGVTHSDEQGIIPVNLWLPSALQSFASLFSWLAFHFSVWLTLTLLLVVSSSDFQRKKSSKTLLSSTLPTPHSRQTHVLVMTTN